MLVSDQVKENLWQLSWSLYTNVINATKSWNVVYLTLESVAPQNNICLSYVEAVIYYS